MTLDGGENGFLILLWQSAENIGQGGTKAILGRPPALTPFSFTSERRARASSMAVGVRAGELARRSNRLCSTGEPRGSTMTGMRRCPWSLRPASDETLVCRVTKWHTRFRAKTHDILPLSWSVSHAEERSFFF